jgi:hypothetical protein
MIEPNEIVMFFIGLGVWLFTFFHRARLKDLPTPKIILAAFYSILASIAATVVEGFFWTDFFNLVEHACLTVSAVLMAAWSWKIFTHDGETG